MMSTNLLARLSGRLAGLSRHNSRLVALLGLVCVLVLSAGCRMGVASQGSVPTAHPVVRGSGNLITRDLALSDFSEIEVDSSLKVDLTRGEAFKVSITSDDNAIDYVLASKTGRTVKLALQPGSYTNVTFRVAVTMPDVTRMHLGGASTATLSGFRPQNLDVLAMGASHLTGRLEAGAIDLSVGGASKVNLGGTAQALSLTANGAGEASLGDLLVSEAKVAMKEASNATINVKGRLDADLRSASNLYYVGNPSLGTISSLEASSIRRR